jgi:hypothetical protein
VIPCTAVAPPTMKISCEQSAEFQLIMTVFLELVATLPVETRSRPPVSLSAADQDLFLPTLMNCLWRYMAAYKTGEQHVQAAEDPKPAFAFVRSCHDACVDFHGRAGLLNVFLWLVRVFLFGRLPSGGSYPAFSRFVDRDQDGIESVLLDEDCWRVLKAHSHSP